MGELAQAMNLLKRGKLSTAILKYPSGRYGIVGSIPFELTIEKRGKFGKVRNSMVWETEQEVVDALLNIGVMKFQMSDCSWFEIAG